MRDHLVAVQHRTVHLSVPLRFEELQGSGICINQSCSVIATTYHLQRLSGRANLGVAGGSSTKVLSLAQESDTNKTDVLAGRRTLSYNIANDVSFVYTKKPVHHKSGIPYSYHFYGGQKVEVAGYYRGRFETREARIIGANVPLRMGRAKLDNNLVLDADLKPGQSGSAVLDESGNLLGMIILTGAIKSRSGDLTASIALPVLTIAKALVKLDPPLGSTVFTNMPEEEQKPVHASAVVYQNNDLPDDTSPVIPELSAVPSDVSDPVGKLRAKADVSARFLHNFLAKQCLAQGTQKPICHEIGMVDGQETYRRIKRNGELGEPTTSFPILKYGVWNQSEWLDVLSEIADNPWVFQGVVNDHYLFSFQSSVEDDRCYYLERPVKGIPIFGGGHPPWEGSVACYEQVVTDKDFNVLSVFTELRPPGECLAELFQTAMYYDWTELEGLKSPVPFPTKERIAAKFQGQTHLWYASVTWTGYRKFRASHKFKM